ncbi:MAG: TIGR01212 family radical SAM protein [Ruminococcus sp.]|nr:TIGR01212 family radical SAM protein [Ruminococcus sp.]
MNKNPFPFSNDNKRYHTLNYHNKKVFGSRVQKAVLECGFTCPNIDGSKGTGGCIFCDGGSGYFTRPGLSVTDQLASETERIRSKFGNVPVIAYFQANTNTYAPADHLKALIYEALHFPGIAGISIGTRGDCLPDDIVELLKEISSQTFLTVELGMQSCHDSTISSINRCCTHEEFLDGYYKLKSAGIRVCLHLIDGLPEETPEMMIQSAAEAASLKPDAVKLQMLHVIKGTKLADIFLQGNMSLLTKDEYVDIIVRQLEVLPPETVIERITGDGDRRKLIAPLWSADKKSVISSIDKRLAQLDTWQGRRYNEI